jgi:hypothetical protein
LSTRDIFPFLPIHSFLQQSVVHFFATILRIAKFSSSIQFVNVQDLGRTFPMHPWIDSADGRAALRRLLVAYSFRDSRVGYCQGMNFVAAMLLLVMKTEQDAFWMLAVLLENVLFNDCYSENLYGCHVEQRVFKDMFKKKFPR